ncbi:MAG: hypothetical protein ABSH39_16925 [Candidatus Acidiferrum sp.]
MGIREGLARTFGSLVSFLAILFLLLGFYLLGNALEHPVDAQAATVLAAAFGTTVAAILFYYLLKPRRSKHAHARIVRIRRAG